MDSLVDTLMQSLSGNGVSQLSQKVGANPNMTQAALSAALPVLVSGLAQHAAQPQNAGSLHQTLTNHSGQVLDNPSGYVANPDYDQGNSILGNVLGNRRGQVEQGLAAQTGMQPSQIGHLLTIVAPLVMGYLGRQQQQQGLDPSGLANLLAQQQQMAQGAMPGGLEMLGKLLGGQGGSGQQPNIPSGGQLHQG